jgi:hypothetical protein
MSGDKRAFTFEDNKTTFGYGKDPSEEEFNKLLANNRFNFNGSTFTAGFCRCDFDPQIPTENQAEEFAKVKERMRGYLLMQQTSEDSSD